MKKIEFDLLQAKFIIESDDNDSAEFIKEYSSLFLDKLSEINISSSLSQPSDTTLMEQSTIKTTNDVTEAVCSNEEIIELFGITLKQLNYLIDFSNDQIKIIIRNKYLKGTKAEMQVKLSLLYCGACEYKGLKANTKDIRNVCNEYQCLDGNFAQNVKKQNYFNISGAVNADIVLTMPGKDKLVEIIKEIREAMANN